MTSTSKTPNRLTVVFVSLMFISFNLMAVCYAGDFAGTLNSVSITDSAAKNTPPTAVINYTQNGDTYTFDASGSSDYDGSIVTYKWNFGDGATGTGVVTSHEYSGNVDFPVTLTTIDNGGAVALQQVSLLYNPPIMVGSKDAGSSSSNIGQLHIWAYKLPEVPSRDGTLTSISMTLSGGSVETPAKVRFALYTQDPVRTMAGSMVPDAVTIEGEISSSTPQLITLPIESGSPEIKAGIPYWIVYQTTSSWLFFYRDYDRTALSVDKTTTTLDYQWDSFYEEGVGVGRYKIGKCYFTAK